MESIFAVVDIKWVSYLGPDAMATVGLTESLLTLVYAIAIGLSIGATTGLTAELIRDRLIYEKREGDSSGGRPPILLALQPNGAFVIGLKLTEDHITFALTNLEADVIDRTTISTSHSIPEDTAQRVAEGIEMLLKSSGIPQNRLLGVGIGMAGIGGEQKLVVAVSCFRFWPHLRA